ncbi:MAG: xanthine permease [Peptococcaceae bacterium BICA1-7]|nr:MAG: xanthine permease [Peptococcaceae bacterium BICA1-7]HBV98133.1 xanthine permease [Desulfotomaculum sp.]
MSRFELRYRLDELPPPGQLAAFGLQWLAISVPTVIIIGNVVAGLHSFEAVARVAYIQKLFLVSGAALFIQILWGHRLPLIMGPAAVLLVGVAASLGRTPDAVYSAALIGGAVLAAVGAAGLFGRLKRLFTPRVVASILILIAFTLTPTITGLVLGPEVPAHPLKKLSFSIFLVLAMFAANRVLKGIWKSTLIVWAIVAGTLAHLLIFPAGTAAGGIVPQPLFFYEDLHFNFVIDPGILIAFLVCYLALSINDLGSIQSVGEMLGLKDMQGRITRGITITGLAGVLSGFLGVIGPVNFSMSPGVIASTGCASRFTLLPTALGLLALAFMPGAIVILGGIPSTVVGSVLIYIMCSQVAAGLLVAFGSGDGFGMESGLVLGLPLMLGIIISYLPVHVLATFPAAVRPVMGNGFVIGVLSVLIMEHIIYRNRVGPSQPETHNIQENI